MYMNILKEKYINDIALAFNMADSKDLSASKCLPCID